MHSHHRAPKNVVLRSDNTLHAVAVVSNPVRYRSRYGLYEEFERRMLAVPEVNLVTVETAFGDRHHEVTNPDNPNHVRLRTNSELWLKESMINVGESHLPRDWKYLAWVDADVEFTNPNWAQETLHALQHHPIVQMFETAADLGPRNNVVKVQQGFGKQYVTGAPKGYTSHPGYYGDGKRDFWHPGFAWACRRDFWENVHGLMDFCILGSADHHMALALVGDVDFSIPRVGVHKNYLRRVHDWQHRALRAANRDVGYVPGSILHHFHGPKAKRYYVERWSILKKHGYDPNLDIYYDDQGLIALGDHKAGLRDDMRKYFRARDEDSRSDD